MIEVVAGHLASGRWRVKRVGDIPVLSHIQAFSRRAEFRIGPDQLIAIDEQSFAQHPQRIRLTFSDGSYCIADAPNQDLLLLREMLGRHEAAPIASNDQKPWITGMILIFSAWILFELARPLFDH